MSKEKFLTAYGTTKHIEAGLGTRYNYPRIAAAAENPLSTREHFLPLLKDPEHVRAATSAMRDRGWDIPYDHVAHHFNEPTSLSLSERDRHTHIRSMLTKYVPLPADVLERQHCDAEPLVRMSALENKNTTKEQIHRAIESDPDPNVRQVARHAVNWPRN